jgi:hypothetical protein
MVYYTFASFLAFVLDTGQGVVATWEPAAWDDQCEVPVLLPLPMPSASAHIQAHGIDACY